MLLVLGEGKKAFSVYQVHSAAILHLSPFVMVTECYFDWWDKYLNEPQILTSPVHIVC